MENARKTVGRPFTKGNPGGPGRPRGSYVAMLKQIRDEKGDKILASLVRAAISGSLTAIRLVIEHTEGLPVQQVEHGGTINLKVTHVRRPD